MLLYGIIIIIWPYNDEGAEAAQPMYWLGYRLDDRGFENRQGQTIFSSTMVKYEQSVARVFVPCGAKRKQVFQIILNLFIFNINKLCQHQNNL